MRPGLLLACLAVLLVSALAAAGSWLYRRPDRLKHEEIQRRQQRVMDEYIRH